MNPATRTDSQDTRLLLARSFKRFFWLTYDHLGLMLLANLLWLALSIGVVTMPAATAGLVALARRVAAGEDASARDLLRGFREHFVPALKVGLFDLAVLLVLWVNIDFYSHLSGRAQIPGFALAAVLVWAAAFWVLMHIHIYAVLVDGERHLRPIVRNAALLTLDNPTFTIGAALQSFMLIMLSILTGVGVIGIMSSLLSLLHATGHRELLRKYRDGIPEDAPENRTWRHLWRPWESSTRG